MIHTIQSVKNAETQIRRAEITWQTQAFCSFIANTVEDDKARKSMIERATQITLIDDDLSNDSGVDTNSSRSVSGERTLEDIIENGSIQEAMAANDRKGHNIGKLRNLGQA